MVQNRSNAAASLLALLAGASVLAGCAGGHAAEKANRSALGSARGLVSIRHVRYTSPSGSPVAALVALPRTAERRACLIWEFGYGSTKETSAAVWQGAAELGLTTLSIDFHRGRKALTPAAQAQALRDAKALAALVKDTVSDLRGAVAYLHRQPYCRGHVAYAGLSLGGIVGTILAGTDRGLEAAVIMSTPATWQALVGGSIVAPGIRRDPARLAAALALLSPLDPQRFIGRIAPRPVLILSGKNDPLVPHASGLALEEAAQAPKTVINYDGGHNPFAGSAATANAQSISSFLLSRVVEPTFGISARGDGTYREQRGHGARG